MNRDSPPLGKRNLLISSLNELSDSAAEKGKNVTFTLLKKIFFAVVNSGFLQGGSGQTVQTQIRLIAPRGVDEMILHYFQPEMHLSRFC